MDGKLPPTQDRFREVLDYNPETGLFIWKATLSRRRAAGHVAGTLNKHGYIVIGVDGAYYAAHRIAWVHVHGYWPTVIDHINGAGADNRLSNLREATIHQNRANCRRQDRTTSGFKGVTKNGKHGWAARITINRKCVCLGTYPTKEAAHAAYCEAARKHFGEFARAA